MEFQVRYLVLFHLFSVTGCFRWFWVGSLHKNIQLMLKFLKAPFLALTFSYYTLYLPDDVICNIAIYADDTTLFSKCDQASDLWQQLELASELESDLQDTVDYGKKWLAHFNARKTQLLFDQSNNTGATDVKIDGSVLEEQSSFKMLPGPILESKCVQVIFQKKGKKKGKNRQNM